MRFVLTNQHRFLDGTLIFEGCYYEEWDINGEDAKRRGYVIKEFKAAEISGWPEGE